MVLAGKYMSFSDDITAHLESEHMEPLSNGCIDFWFFMESWYATGMLLQLNGKQKS